MLHQVGDKIIILNMNFQILIDFLEVLDLINQNKSNKIIFTAGQLPWTDNWKPEGIILKNKAISLGVPQKKY